MDLLSVSLEWFICLNNSLLDVKFSIIEPDIMVINAAVKNEYYYNVVNKKVFLFCEKDKKKVFATIEKYNQKTLKFKEFKNDLKIFEALMF